MTAADYGLVLVVWLAAVIAPGPDFAIVLRATLRGGRRAGLGATTGIVAGITVWTALAVAGVGALARESGALLAALQCAGGLYLVSLGLPALLRRGEARALASVEKAGTDARALAARREALIAVGANLTNPKALVFFTTVFSVVVPASASTGERTATGLLLIVLEAVWFGGVAWCLTGPRLQPWIDARQPQLLRITGAALSALGAVALISGLRGLL